MRSLDVKATNNTRLEYFAAIIGFNLTEPEEEEEDPVGNLLANIGGSLQPNVDAVAAMTAALESLLVLPSFTTEQAGNVLGVVDQMVNLTGQIESEDDSLKKVTNKWVLPPLSMSIFTFIHRLLNFLDLFSAKIQNEEDHITSFFYDNMNTSLVDMHTEQWDDHDDWYTLPSSRSCLAVDLFHGVLSSLDTTTERAGSVIQLNLAALRTHLASTQHYRIVETNFANFNLFPIPNSSNQSDNASAELIGIPISYQIANWTTIKVKEDLVKVQILVPKVSRSLHRFNKSSRSSRLFLVDSIAQYLLCLLVIRGK